MADLFNVFDDVDEKCRMLCIDSVFVGCYLYKQGNKKAAAKLISTSFTTAGVDDPEIINHIFDDIDESLNTLRVHRELQNLNPTEK